MRRALARVMWACAGAVGVSLAVLGFAHTAPGRPLLDAFTRMARGGCPFGYDKPVTPAERERQRVSFAVTHRGLLRAGARPALGFVLDQTTRSEVVASLAQFGVTCRAAKGMSDLSCAGVPASALGGVPAPSRNLWLTFGEHEQLLAVVAISHTSDASAISGSFVATERALDRTAGVASRVQGDPAPAELARGALRQASAEFRFSDYYALERATNLGTSYALTEEYRSLPD